MTWVVNVTPGIYYAGISRPFFVSQTMVENAAIEKGFTNLVWHDRTDTSIPVNPHEDKNYSDDWDEWVSVEYHGNAATDSFPARPAWLVKKAPAVIPRRVVPSVPSTQERSPMTIPTIDYDVITSTPDERTAIDQVNTALLDVEALKDDAPNPDALKLIASFEAWFGALNERQSHWVVPGVVKGHRVDQADVSEAQRQLYAIKTLMGKVLPGDPAPPNVLPPEQQAKDLGTEIGDAAGEVGSAAKTGVFALLAAGGLYIIIKLLG